MKPSNVKTIDRSSTVFGSNYYNKEENAPKIWQSSKPKVHDSFANTLYQYDPNSERSIYGEKYQTQGQIPSRNPSMCYNGQSYIPTSYRVEESKDRHGQTSNGAEENVMRLKAELTLRDQIIKNLTDQLSATAKTANNTTSTSSNSSGSINKTFVMPGNHYQLLQDMAAELEAKTKELEETKLRLEALIVSISLSTGTRASHSNQYDEQELAHKIVHKITQLKEENDALFQMGSYWNKSSLLIEMALLKEKYEQLKDTKISPSLSDRN